MPERFRLPSSWIVSASVLLGLGAAMPAQAATSVWELVYQTEAAMPWDEGKLARSLGIALQRVGQGGDAAFRSGSVKVDDGKLVESVTFTPKRGAQPASVAVRMPAALARSENCLGRGDVSRQYGAPVRNWATQEGEATFSHFEFARPGRGKISVAFSDLTNCLTVLTVEEPA